MIKSSLFISRTLPLLFILSIISCNNNPQQEKTTVKKTTPPPVRKQPPAFTYSLVKRSGWFKQNDSLLDDSKKNIIVAVNRTDNENIRNLDSIIVPSDLSGDLEFYLHFPTHVQALEEVSKILLFSYTTQTFAAYENGELMYSGPTNMGRKKDPTPTGLYFCNWKAEQTTSTFNDEWDLKWNFNIQNKEGIGFHQYALPGYPASHSCLRLREADAKFLYNWADQWELKGTDDILAQGTPVIVFGSYNFSGPKPWKQLTADVHALDMDANMISQLVSTYQKKISEEQLKREQYLLSAENKN